MNMMETTLLVVHLLIAAAICGFVLLQHGKGADMGAAFGSGASGSLFGASGSANFLSRTTAILAAVFFASSLGLTWFGSHHGTTSGVMHQGVMEKSPEKSLEKTTPKTPDIPAAPSAPPAGAPATDPAKAAEPAKATPPAADGSKAGEVPK